MTTNQDRNMTSSERVARLGVLVPLLLAGLNASAALIGRGSDMVYDDILNVTWVRNANLCQSLNNCVNPFDDVRTGVIGGMRWNDANDWASNLVFRGYDDWRLPWASVNQQAGPVGDSGVVNCATASRLECRDNEMGYMYFHNLPNLGDVGLYNIQGEGWSGTAQGGVGSANDGSVQWAFAFSSGRDDQAFGNAYGMMAWAVRDGDVSNSGPAAPPPALPEPSTLALVAAGLLGVTAIGNRKRHTTGA